MDQWLYNKASPLKGVKGKGAKLRKIWENVARWGKVQVRTLDLHIMVPFCEIKLMKLYF